MEKNKKSIITEDNTINSGLIKDLKVHTNLAQDVLVTTEDKIRICLMNYLNKIEKKSNWVAPFGILLTIMITLLTTNFKKFYFSADTWTAIFIIAAGLSFIWFLLCIRDAFISIEMNYVIDELKKSSSSEETQTIQKPKIDDEVFKIIKGTYGIIDKNVDVTDKLNGMIEDGKLHTEATNSLVDSDPVPGTQKFLNVEYEYRGERLTKQFKENSVVNLP